MNSILDKLFRKKVIHDCDGLPYMHRWFVLRSKHLGIFIHKFVRSDFDRALHDHPWNFLVIPLWRGYIEHTVELVPASVDPGDEIYQIRFHFKRRVLPIFGTRFRSAEFRHRVELFVDTKNAAMKEYQEVFGDKVGSIYLPAWSLFIRFSKRRDWGFWLTDTIWKKWNLWWKDNCGEEPDSTESYEGEKL